MSPELRDKYTTALGSYKEAKAEKDHATSLVLDELGEFRNAVSDGSRFAYRTARANADGTPGMPYLATDWRSLKQQEKSTQGETAA